MRLLVKGDGLTRMSMHIADATGAPLCRRSLRMDLWHIQKDPAPTGFLCAQCHQINAGLMRRPAPKPSMGRLRSRDGTGGSAEP